ncbi:GntR family transcriptional regulator [Melissococcus plutonius]|uniref:Regulatory protein GntR n=1 Tax=Melissococcus plutonius TaxID=33970 RepID=A0A2Z5Y413_9ENTE|nr:GntR family transcriptional regulator [Melissococcus plutonius]BAL62625.1 regulatory protein GntR [Melissococcus plutonius DAT561]MCV2498550.1 GntR family transcriptional regulator [Melissococcus plutonius]MCV2501285.1 GntR family transcriptional regulator [Melissococcus plutonius]MCV2504782.1 GntR family transcriptional regulator [Melissococcus plutonius]MCV2507242.1 GntR family transcriptional regulator [Melissococcus plutonius]
MNNLQAQAYKIIRKKIIYSELEPGQKISEKNLTDMLQIGRTPIREALLQLRQQELIYTIPQSGTYVSPIDLTSARNARFVREQLERKIMIECCTKIDDKAKSVLELIINRQEEAAELQDRKAFFQADNKFHETCFGIANRKEIWNWLDDYNIHLERFRWLRVTINGLKWFPIIEQHQQLFNALSAKDTDEVDFLTATHLHMMLDEQKFIVERYPDYFKQSQINQSYDV